MRALFLISALAFVPARAAKPLTAADTPGRDNWTSLNMEAQAVLGELQLQTGDVGRAQRTYERSLELGTKLRGPRGDVAAQVHFRTAEIALAKGEYVDARRHLELLLQRYPETEWARKGRLLIEMLPGRDRAAASRPDEPFVPAFPSGSPEESLARLRAAIDEGRTEAALAEAYEFRRKYPQNAENDEVALAAGALHLRRGEAARAARFLKPIAFGRDAQLKPKALHLLGAALASLGLDEAALKVLPAADPAAAADRWIALMQVWRAAALERLGRRDEAAELYRAVSASGHRSPVKAYALAAIAADWDRRGRSSRAHDALARAREESERWGLVELAESVALSDAHLLRREQTLEAAADAYQDFSLRFRDSPLRPQALFQRALCLKRLGRGDEAADALEKLVSSHPDSAFAADAHLQLGQIYTEAGRTDAALDNYRRMAKLAEGPNADLEALLLMAQVHYNAKRWPEAIPLYKRYLTDAPPSPRTKEVEGLLLTAVWQNDADDAELPALVARYPNHAIVARIRWDLAAKAYKRGDWAAAEELFRRHLEENPHAANAPDARFFRAECLAQQGRKPDAAAEYRRFLASSPGHKRASEASMRLGALLLEAGDAKGAAEAYAKVKGADAGDAAYNRALALAKDAAPAEGAKAWAAFAGRHPEHPKSSYAWLQIGRLREEAGDLGGAAAAYPKADEGADRLKALYALGRLEERRKRTREAKSAYERLRALTPPEDPARVAGLLRLGLMLELEDKPREAAPIYAELLRRAERGGQTFETARKRLEALSSDKSLLP